MAAADSAQAASTRRISSGSVWAPPTLTKPRPSCLMTKLGAGGDAGGLGSGVTAVPNAAPDQREWKEERCGEPHTKANRSRHIHGDGNAARYQRCGEDTKLPHAVHKNKRKVVSP